MMFKMEMMCTKVSYCCICSCISKFIHHLISIVSFVVFFPISQCSATPKKGNRLLLGCGSSAVVYLSRTGLVLSTSIAVHMVGSYDC